MLHALEALRKTGLKGKVEKNHFKAIDVLEFFKKKYLCPAKYGGVAERLNAPVLKTDVRDERTGGSNPSSSATQKSKSLVNL